MRSTSTPTRTPAIAVIALLLTVTLAACQEAPDAETAVSQLIEAACQAGGKDNITVLAAFDRTAGEEPVTDDREES